MSLQASRRTYTVLLVAMAIAIGSVFVFQALRVWHLTRDDGYIYFRYVENIRDGLGPVFNQGQRVEGFSSPLWLLFLVSVSITGAPIVFGAKILGLCLVILTGVMAWKLSLILVTGETGAETVDLTSRLEALVATFAFLFLDFSTIYYGVSGLDTNLTMFFYTVATYLLIRDLKTRESPSVPAGIFLGAVAWVRPEAPLFTALGIGVLLGRFGRKSVRAIAAATSAIVLLFFLRLAYYGVPLPNTYYAKNVPISIPALLRGFLYSSNWLVHFGHGLAAFLALVVVGRLITRKALWPVVFLSLPIVTCAALVFRAGGDWMRFFRFYNPSYGVLTALAAAGFLLSYERVRAHVVRAVALAVVVAVMLLGSYRQLRMVVANPFQGPEALWRHPTLFFPAVPYNIKQFELARWLHNNVKPGTLVAHGDMGLTPFLNIDKRFVDYYGLVTPRVARLKGVTRTATGVQGNELNRRKGIGRFLFDLKPDIIVARWESWGGRTPELGDAIWGGAYRAVHIIDHTFIILQRSDVIRVCEPRKMSQR